ncbi:MAG: DegT/DnrJ/EryC1/StrS family aminotransferase [Actinomycetota bacterium]
MDATRPLSPSGHPSGHRRTDRAPVRRREDFLVFGAPQITDAEIGEVVASMRDGWLGSGPKVARFEDAFGVVKGSAHAVAVSSCTAALHLSMLAAGVGAGDEVIVPALTFCATVNAVIHAGATPVLADVDPATMNIDPGDAAARITARTRAIVPVHFAGRPCDMEALTALAARHDLAMIEDCAHAIETRSGGTEAGRFGRMGCFSFYATKNVTTGEGGMVITDDAELADAVRVAALHGLSRDAWRRYSDAGFRHYEVVSLGFKYNMMDLQAAIGLHQLSRLQANWERRRQVWETYRAELSGLPVTGPADPEPGTRHAHHLYPILVDERRAGLTRDAFLDAMTAEGIGVGVHYRSVPEHRFYQDAYGWRPEDWPHACRIGRQTVSLPLSPTLTDRDVGDVMEAVRRSLGG